LYLPYFSANDIISAMKFGRFGQEDYMNGGLTAHSQNIETQSSIRKTGNTFCLIGCVILTATQ
jgi:hypothetical protein